MNTIRNFLCALLALLTTSLAALSVETNAIKLTAPQTHPGKLYADTCLSLSTRDFNTGTYAYGIGVGYQASKHWGVDFRFSRDGLDAEGSAVQGIGGRLVARMPFEFLSPYTFLGATFDLERDQWRMQPGAGLEIGVSKKLKGLSVFTEGSLDADLNGRSGYVFGAGIRLRF